MNKKTKIAIGIILAIVVIIIFISINFPPVFRGITSGTFGKADKYRKSQMTEKDIQLRSTFTSDTAQLRQMVSGLIFFAGFTAELSKDIDSCVYDFWHQDLTSAQVLSENLQALSDYSGFIKNNNKVLDNTIKLLAGFYTKKNEDQSADVEKTLRDFGSYVNNLAQRDSILEISLRSMDNFMLTNKKLQSRKSELLALKSIRDQLLIKEVQLAGLVQDKKLCSLLVNLSLDSQKDFDKLLAPLTQLALAKLKKPGSLDLAGTANEKLPPDLASKDVTFSSADDLQLSLVSTKGKESKDKNKVYVYNKSTLSFSLVSASNVSRNEVGRNEVGRNEVGRNEVGRNEVGRNEVGRNEVGRNEVGRNEVGRNEVGRNEVGRNEVGRNEVGRNEVGRNEVGRNEVGRNEVGRNEVGRNEVGRNEVGRNEVGRQVVGVCLANGSLNLVNPDFNLHSFVSSHNYQSFITASINSAENLPSNISSNYSGRYFLGLLSQISKQENLGFTL